MALIFGITIFLLIDHNFLHTASHTIQLATYVVKKNA